MKWLTSTMLFCFLTASAWAQTKKAPSLQDMQRDMQEMQRQLWQQLQQTPGGGSFALPEWKWDTTFSFQFDTIMGDQGFSQQFFFSPFGQDTSFFRGLFDSNPFMDGFKPFGEGFQWSFPPLPGFPGNDENSALTPSDDGLLPEERLRIDDVPETGPSTAPPAEKQPAPAPNKSKIKTIRL
jgi:hypothetical protein